VLICSDGALIYWLLHASANIINKHGAIVKANSEQCRMDRVPVERADPSVCVEDILRISSVLERVAANNPSALTIKVVRSEAYGAKVVVSWIPFDGSHLLPLRLLRRETPQWQKSSIPVAELVATVLPVLEIVVNFVFCILIYHALHNFDR